MWVYRVSRIDDTMGRDELVRAVELVAKELGLSKVSAEHKEARSHWHWKKAGVTGTLEVTLDRHRRTVQVLVHENRVGADGWAKDYAPLFARALAERLGGLTTHAADRR